MPLNVLRVLEQLEITLPPTSAASSHRQAAETHLEHAREELEKLKSWMTVPDKLAIKHKS